MPATFTATFSVTSSECYFFVFLIKQMFAYILECCTFVVLMSQRMLRRCFALFRAIFFPLFSRTRMLQTPQKPRVCLLFARNILYNILCNILFLSLFLKSRKNTAGFPFRRCFDLLRPSIAYVFIRRGVPPGTDIACAWRPRCCNASGSRCTAMSSAPRISAA